MNLFTPKQIDVINAQAAKSAKLLEPVVSTNSKSINSDLNRMSEEVIKHFKDADSILITTESALAKYVDAIIEFGYCGIDSETTGLDRQRDYVVGISLYVPGKPDCYIPIKHMIPIFNELRKNQLTYTQVAVQLQRLVDNRVKTIYAEADFDLAMVYKDLKVDLIPSFYYDVILAWRCLKENEKRNGLKALYQKYVLQGEGNAMRFSDFFTPELFPFCDPEVAKLYAGNDAKITYELFMWQLPYLTKTDSKCKKSKLEKISDLVWNIEFPLVAVCQRMHRQGMYLEQPVAKQIQHKYIPEHQAELLKLQGMVQDVMDNPKYSTKAQSPFVRSSDFNPSSPKHVAHLCYNMLKLEGSKGTDKDKLAEFNLPITKQILKCRSLSTVINTFINKLPRTAGEDSKIHCQFRQIGASTGRLSSTEPNMQNIPSKMDDIRHMFRASPGYVLLSCDYSAQEPRLTAYCSNDAKMIEAFKADRDIYGSIGSIAFNVPYEECLEFTAEGKYNPEGKHRRDSIKTVLLGASYGRSIETIAEQLYGKDKSLSDDQKLKKGQAVYDAVMFACPALRTFMLSAQNQAKALGYVETILGRRRHIPEMQLPEFEFYPLFGYVNPDIDPLDISTLDNKAAIPDRIMKDLIEEFSQYKYFGQIVKRTRELNDNDKIRVVNNKYKISEASRKCVNSIIQGSAADQIKMAMLLISKDPEWARLGARLIVPVHDELIAEVPVEHWEEGAALLNKLMLKAAEFLPFPSKCDVTISYRWYGLEFPCKYTKPTSLDRMTEAEISWVQYHLFECGYPLPIIAKKGEELSGDPALGVNGIYSDTIQEFVNKYIQEYGITPEKFIDHIHRKVHTGIIN